MSDTRNHATRELLAAALYGLTWTSEYADAEDEIQESYRDRADELLASDAIAAVRAAAVAETTAAIEALLDTLPRCDRPIVGLYGAETRCVRRAGHIGGHNGIGTHGRADDLRAALSGGRTALDTTLAQARRQALLDAADHLDGTCTEMECGSPAHWAAAALRHRANEGSNQ